MNPEEPHSKKKGFHWDHLLIWIFAIALTITGIVMLLRQLPQDDDGIDELLQETVTIEIETTAPVPDQKKEPEQQIKSYNPVPQPDIDVQLLTINEYSRPGTKTDSLDYIVIHYLANPRTTAQENHDYFESLKDLKDVSMSANFIVGTDGEIIECVPPGEIAWASNEMNSKSISIENCHFDNTGRFTEDTYNSLIHLTAWLCCEYNIDRDHIIRHYDVTGKECPLFYVENPDLWEALKDDVMDYIEECSNE